MFTGIVQAVGTVEKLSPVPSGVRVVVNPGGWGHNPAPGDSIAISGCCLTVAEPPGRDRWLAFDAIPETLEKTTLGGLAPGDHVNLEHPVSASGLMGGHVVQGHVDGVASVVSVETGEGHVLRIEPAPDLMKFVIPKGSVTIEGVSLTNSAVCPAPESGSPWFEVALIPTTLRETTLGRLVTGDPVNLECDILAKTVVHFAEHYAGLGR